jgi:molybdate transport system substrate-binding protein
MRWLLGAFALVLAALAGCGGDGSGPQPLTVSAASSLKSPFESYQRIVGNNRVRYSFGGSDQLAAQIRQGVRPDVFAAANAKLPDELFRKGLVERPVVFATNRLVVAARTKSNRVRSLGDLERPGTRLVIGSDSVPVGAYTREFLDRLGGERAKRILANVRSTEPDVASVVAKLTQSAADAGFVYVTDVEAALGKLRAIGLPARLAPRVEYSAAVVKGAERPREAKAFVRQLLDGPGREALKSSGFLPPPR